MIYVAAMLTAALAAHAEDCGKLAALKLKHVTVVSADVPADSASKIAYCRVQATSKPTADSDIRFELWIPLGSAWNGKFQQVGNGGFAGTIPSRAMAYALASGFAVAGTDDGHQSADMTDASWALDHDEKVEDYGWRAISETTLASQRILKRFKSSAPTKSYFIGCSDGGREALMMAQRFPTYFDGIVAGAPAYAMSRLLTGGAVRNAELTAAAGHLSSMKLLLLQNFVLKTCGNGARYLQDPRRCQPDLAALRCAGSENDSCLTDAQLVTVRAIYQERRGPAKGERLYGVLPGAEAVTGSWDTWLTGADDGRQPAGVGFTRNYLANMVMHDAHVDPAKVTDEDIARAELHYAPLMDAADPDLSAFKARGGKLIHYHGWNDPGIPPGYSLEYRARVVAAMGTVDDFYRLYMVPGMLHCAGGDAPTFVDWQAAIEAWVEKGTPPSALIARDERGGTQTLTPFVAAATPAQSP
jgi:pimeloyl-ACP methyl ester carboxylesterase